MSSFACFICGKDFAHCNCFHGKIDIDVIKRLEQLEKRVKELENATRCNKRQQRSIK